MSRRALLIAPLLLLALAGCVPVPGTPDPASSGTPTGSGSPSATATAGPTATPTPTPVVETEPVTLGCSDLISAQDIYDYNPNVTLIEAFTPDPGSLAAQAATRQGLACRLVNQSSGETIDIGVIRFTSAAFAAKQSSVSGDSTAAGSFDGYFDDGVAQAFASPYWVTVTSSAFQDGSDAAAIVTPILGSLG